MRLFATISVLAVCAVALGPAASAQIQQGKARRELVGLVRDSSGAAIEGATIEIKGGSAVTSASGTFQLWTGEIDTLTISIRRIGYAPLSAQIAARGGRWDTVSVEMDRTSQQLAAVSVTGVATRRALGLRTFEERRARGNGIFITRDEITARNTMHTSDVLRGRRGLTMVRLRDGSYGARFASYRAKSGACTPLIWVDGQSAPGLEVDEIIATDIEAIELYESIASVPFEFTPHGPSLPCGTIVIWTRIPGTK